MAGLLGGVPQTLVLEATAPGSAQGSPTKEPSILRLKSLSSLRFLVCTSHTLPAIVTGVSEQGEAGGQSESLDVEVDVSESGRKSLLPICILIPLENPRDADQPIPAQVRISPL